MEISSIPRLGRGERVLVLGAGVVGLAVARELAGRGLEVEVLEAGRVGAGASSASIGVLSSPKPRKSALGVLLRRGYELYGDLAEELRDETGIDIGLREVGALALLERPPRRSASKISRLRGVGVRARVLDRAGIEEAIPGYRGRFSFALELDREAVIEPCRLVEALHRSCRKRGAVVREEAPAGDLRMDGARGVIVPGQRPATAVVLAAGCWSSSLSALLAPGALRVRPIRGQALEVAGPAPRRVVHFTAAATSRGYHVVPRSPERFWVGSTVEDVGFADAVTGEGRDELLGAASEIVPIPRDATPVRHWSGLRPQATRRGGPFLGAWPTATNLWVAAGHYRSGILAGPVSARLLADAMVDGAPLPEELAPWCDHAIERDA